MREGSYPWNQQTQLALGYQAQTELSSRAPSPKRQGALQDASPGSRPQRTARTPKPFGAGFSVTPSEGPNGAPIPLSNQTLSSGSPMQRPSGSQNHRNLAAHAGSAGDAAQAQG